ncbi:MAG TPA: histidine kinase [Spirochaetales bacterium]|nr:histidine kinase [Spirochaetales bacterium]HRY53258.1 histidine kinase [Spirochaetia bacterium]HRZ65159.1 histidine kinase [Spirochaetia bacterium]
MGCVTMPGAAADGPAPNDCGLLRSRFASGVLVALCALARAGEGRGGGRHVPETLEIALGELSRIFYYAEGRGDEAPLREELDFAERYLRLQAIRFEGRLRFAISRPTSEIDRPTRRLGLFESLERAVAEGLELREGEALIVVEAASPGGEALEPRVRLAGGGAPGPLP